MGYWQATLAKVGLAQPGPKITSQDRAILDLKLQRDKMKQYQKRLQAVLNREQEIAKQALAEGNKKRALTALRQKKYQESLLIKTDSQLQTLQELVSTIEFTQIQATVMQGLSMGNEVLKQLHQEMSLEKVEKLMDQTKEGVEYQREIDETLQSRMSPEEEEAVQAELEALQREAMPNVPVPVAPEREGVAMPDVPVEEPAEPTVAERRKEEKVPQERVAMPA